MQEGYEVLKSYIFYLGSKEKTYHLPKKEIIELVEIGGGRIIKTFEKGSNDKQIVLLSR